MTTVRSTMRALSLSCLGAIVALGVTGLSPSYEAEAQRPGRLSRCKSKLQTARNDLASYQSAYQELLAGLDRIERINERRPKQARKRIRRAVTNARHRASQYVISVPAQPAPAPAPAPPPPPPADPGYEPAPAPPQGPVVIGKRTFRKLLASVKGKSFPKERIAAIREASRYNAFTVRQVIKLMNACTFESTKVDVAVMLHAVVVDIENWFQIYDAFTYPSSRKKVKRRLRR